MCPFGVVATLLASFRPDAIMTLRESCADSERKKKREEGKGKKKKKEQTEKQSCYLKERHFKKNVFPDACFARRMSEHSPCNTSEIGSMGFL